MYTSLIVLALSGSVAPAEAIPSPPAWRSDYRSAAREGLTLKRPLAVFVAAGPEGWEKVSKEGVLGKEARHLLERNYVCVYVDTSSERGQRLAELFEITGGQGLVISDVSGEKQAFWHAGGLSARDLEHYLRKYADGERTLVATETAPEARPAVVAPAHAPSYAPSYAPSFAPSYAPSAAPMSGGRSC